MPQVNLCVNCDQSIPEERKVKLYCSEWCRAMAKDIRYHRGTRRRAVEWQDDVQLVLSVRQAWLFCGLVYKSQLPRQVRDQVFIERGRICLLCGQTQATDIDHIVGGAGDHIENLRPLCSECHDQKSFRSLIPLAVQPLTADEQDEAGPEDTVVVFVSSGLNGAMLLVPGFAPTSEAIERYARIRLEYWDRVNSAQPKRDCDSDGWEESWRTHTAVGLSEADLDDIFAEALGDDDLVIEELQAAGLSDNEAVIETLILSAND